MSDSYQPLFSGSAPHPPGYVCNALCTPRCVEGATPEPVPVGSATVFADIGSAELPAPRPAADSTTSV